MPITPLDIEQLTFSPSKHGYNTDEVDDFLERLSDEVGTMLQKIADLKGRLNTTEQQLAESQARVAQLEAGQADGLAVPVMPAQQDSYSASERQISQALIVAQQSADKLLADARENADLIRTEADKKAREVIRQALAEKQAELDEIDRLKQSREDFRNEYMHLLQHYMDDAEAVFPEGVTAGAVADGATTGTVASDVVSSQASSDNTVTTSASTWETGKDASVIELDDLD